MSGSPEQFKSEPEKKAEIKQPDTEQLEKIVDNPETSIESSAEDAEARTESARVEAEKHSIDLEANKKAKKSKERSNSLRRGQINKKQRDESYKRTMKRVRDELPATNRVFSKFIHNKAIEKTSDVIGNTIARPDAILAGAVVAFILTLLTYTISKTIGYKLSGFETIAAFIVGWIIGIIYDYLRVLFTGKKS